MEIDLRKKVSFYLDFSLFLKSRYVYELGQGLAEEKRMAIIKGLEWTFNTVAEEYDKWSPEYVSELYEDLFDYQPLTLNSEALEVGIGTGQATLPILRTGCKLTAVELGDQLAELTRRKFKDYVNLAVVTSSFQDFDDREDHYDLIYSASAFHWIPEEIGYPKVYQMLKSKGTFARFAKHGNYRLGNQDMYEKIQEIYAQYMPYSVATPPFSEADAMKRSKISLRYGFIDQKVKLYTRKRSYTAQEYVSLIATQSDHIVLKESLKNQFYSAIKQVIEDKGGRIELIDTIDLELARKP